MQKIIFVTMVLTMVGGLAVGCQGPGKQNFESKASYEANLIEEIEINNDSWDMEFKNSESRQITIVCKGKQQDKKSDPVTITHDGNKIVVTQQDEGGMDGFSFGKKGTIYISIPDNEVDMIKLNNGAGDIKMKDVAAHHIVISNDSGTEILEGLSADKGEFTSNDGELTLKNSSLNELKVTSISGGSYISGVTSPEIEITSINGEVSIKEIQEGKSLRVETKSGDISVSYKAAPGSLSVRANSDSSDISIDLDGFREHQSTEKSVEGAIGGAANQLELLSQNGTISVK
ncbi:DUF4097 family beta strand repeat-containing protein [Paenibacillus sp. J2TS4]|uniref:DUF4097 family beta strand repeat-containing protein n=1 Tax=Paenibacillus sp. J2TS4 TaxID=2807194 RepID=UPI001B2B97ED|nr:DUF4097 family beta strand repeat-containing protein [Paenibacillus sp. J2TS4]GIP34889.1 hypothetical protein J2TS4_40990 [Paenibacillus sp. J2TS4]